MKERDTKQSALLPGSIGADFVATSQRLGFSSPELRELNRLYGRFVHGRAGGTSPPMTDEER